MTLRNEIASLERISGEAWPQPVSWTWFAALAVAIYLVDVALSWPFLMDFKYNYFGDPGANLVVQALVGRGLRPTIDFVYQYGLLGLLFGREWFALFSASPLSYRISGFVFGLWIIASLTRIVRDQRIGLSGAAILLIGLTYFVPSGFVNFVHGLESSLLCHALAEQARGRRSTALAFVTAAVLTKPSMGFVYGLILVLLILRSFWGRWSARGLLGAEGFGPAIATGAALIAVLAAVYGVVPVVKTVIPTAGMTNYRAANFGFFFGIGRYFWHPPGARVGYYLGTAAGFWIVGSLTLLAGGLDSVHRLFRPRSDGGSPNAGSLAELIATCALLHTAFVCLLYGNAWSWTYYAYILGIGLAAITRLGPGWRGWVWGLVILAALGHKSYVTGRISEWRNRPSEVTGGLWASVEVRDEWNEVLSLTHNHQWALLNSAGCCELMSPGVDPPESFFLMHGMDEMDVAPEIRRKADQLALAEIIVVPKLLGMYQVLVSWPEFATVLSRFKKIHEGPEFLAYQRIDPL